MRIRRKLSDDEIKELYNKYGRIYPYPYETQYPELEFYLPATDTAEIPVWHTITKPDEKGKLLVEFSFQIRLK